MNLLSYQIRNKKLQRQRTHDRIGQIELDQAQKDSESTYIIKGGKVLKEQWMQKTVVVWFLAMICCLLWGSAFPCIKIGYKMFHIASADASSQLLFAGCRFFLAGVLVLLLGTSGNFKLKKTEIPMAMTLAVFQTILQYVFFIWDLPMQQE